MTARARLHLAAALGALTILAASGAAWFLAIMLH